MSSDGIGMGRRKLGEETIEVSFIAGRLLKPARWCWSSGVDDAVFGLGSSCPCLLKAVSPSPFGLDAGEAGSVCARLVSSPVGRRWGKVKQI